MTITEIITLAKECASQRKDWHFHILTPGCQLNVSEQYALVLENVTEDKKYIVYSDEPYMDVGQELVKLLHGDEVVKNKEEEKMNPPSQKVVQILERAHELSNNGIFWHHHLLFPGCKYSKYTDKWVIVFEDPDRGEIIESNSDYEPKSDLQHIEGLFYSQKK